jgi:hypothetical protein
MYLPPQASNAGGPKKIFVGSLPDGVSETVLREEFSKYGQITDVHLKTGQDKGKNWAFMTFNTTEEANLAKNSTDRVLTFPGGDKPCEVMLARHQGMNGQEPLTSGAGGGQGPCKVFVGSLPDSITEMALRAEFSKYGQITDLYLKTGCDSGKQWSFLNFASHAQAQHAKDATDRVLVFPGATGPCETMFAKNQGRNGQETVSSDAQRGTPVGAMQPFGAFGAQPPPPIAPLPPHLSAWRCYYTAAGLPYYYNHMTAVTQWECPPEFQQMQAMQAHGAMQMQMAGGMPGSMPGAANPQAYAAMAAQAQAQAAAQAQAQQRPEAAERSEATGLRGRRRRHRRWLLHQQRSCGGGLGREGGNGSSGVPWNGIVSRPSRQRSRPSRGEVQKNKEHRLSACLHLCVCILEPT